MLTTTVSHLAYKAFISPHTVTEMISVMLCLAACRQIDILLIYLCKHTALPCIFTRSAIELSIKKKTINEEQLQDPEKEQNKQKHKIKQKPENKMCESECFQRIK